MGRGPGRFYETNLMRKDNQPPLKNSISNSFGRLSNLVKNLTRRNQSQRHDNIIQDQIKKDIIQKVDEVSDQEKTEGEKVFICHIDLS